MSDENQSGNINASADSEQDIKAKKRRLQYDLLIMDADFKKITNKREELLAEIKKLRRQADLLRVQIDDKEKEEKKIENEEMLAKNEMSALKKKINLMN
jgi:hypothetical protein